MQSTITDGTSAVSAVQEILAERIGEQKYKIWFRNSARFVLGGGYLKIGVPNTFMAGWIENHFSEILQDVCKKVTGDSLRLAFYVDAELAGSQRRRRFSSAGKPQSDKTNKPFAKKTKSYINSDRIGKKLKLQLDNFVVGKSNELAYRAACSVVNEKQCPFNPLFIHGGYGVGKTHLLQGICNQMTSNRPETSWLYLSAEDFANQFILAMKTKKLEAFRRRMRKTDLLVIDDIHFLASKPSMQEEFLHTFNSVDLAGKQVVLASDAHPKMIGQLSEKLVNRFVSGMVVKVDNPDFETRCGILRKRSRELCKHVSDSVISYVAENVRSNARELEGALLKLVAFSSLQGEQINLASAQAILRDHISRTDPIVHTTDIEAVVSEYFGVTPASLHSPKKSRTVSLARHFSMYLTRKHTNMSSSEIGRCMGGKNHATVLLACKKIAEQIESDCEICWSGSEGNRIVRARTISSELESRISK